VIVDLAEYPEVQRNDHDTVKATPYLFIVKKRKPAGLMSLPAFFVPSSGHASRPHALS
jgi:hypothetical protein